MIALKGIKKVYNSETSISLKDYEFINGSSYCILGPSGSGKSTLLNILAGIVKPTEGSVVINDKQMDVLSQKEIDEFRWQNIGYISQDLKLFEDFSVLDNLNILKLGGDVTFKSETVLEWVGLGHKANSKVRTLSGGEKQRVAIARALLKSPKVMLCDEPTASLNTSKGIEIIELLIKLHKEQKNTLIVVTHDDRLSKYFGEVIKFEDIQGGE